jgi:hypothetical protein
MKIKKKVINTLEEIALILIFMLIYASVFLFMVGIDL